MWPIPLQVYVPVAMFVLGFVLAAVGVREADRSVRPAECLCAGLAGGVDLAVKCRLLMIVLPWEHAADVCVLLALVKVAGPQWCRYADSLQSRGAHAGAFLLKLVGAPAATALGAIVGSGACAITGSADIRFRKSCLVFVPRRRVWFRDWAACALGGCVVFVRRPVDDVVLEHERYHTEQYTAMGEGLIVIWATVAALWGAMTTPRGQACLCLRATLDGRRGNPIERGAYRHHADLPDANDGTS